MHIYVCVCIYICMYVCVYMCVFVCSYLSLSLSLSHIYTHTLKNGLASHMRSHDSKQLQANFTQVFPQQLTGDLCQVCGSVAGLRYHIKVHKVSINTKTVLLLVTCAA